LENAEDLTFEQAFQQLGEVVQELEGGELPLEQSLDLFERGMALARLCEGKLDAAEQKVQQLVDSDVGGPVLAPFGADE
jgi:exodeoxyribonuclease VII small subunit